MTWEDVIRKKERDLTYVDSEYADEQGNSIVFYGYPDKTKKITIPKSYLNEVIDAYDMAEYGRPFTRSLKQLTVSAIAVNDFIDFYNDYMDRMDLTKR